MTALARLMNPRYETTSLPVTIAGVDAVLDLSGALFLPDDQVLVVSDLHFEKASSYARRGQFIPPYDTGVTLTALEHAVAQYAPRIMVCLGDSFHDPFCGERLAEAAIARLAALSKGRQWIWITGNHDPEIPSMLDGERLDELCLGHLSFRHVPLASSSARGEIAGHLHPCARIIRRERSVRRPCFATDGERLVMPAFGALTGGLDLLQPAFKGLFDHRALTAYMIGTDRIHPLPASALS